MLATALPCSMKIDLVAVGGQRPAEGRGQDDAPVAAAPRDMPQALRRLDLALRRRQDGAAEDLGRVGGGVEHEGEKRAEPGSLQERPKELVRIASNWPEP